MGKLCLDESKGLIMAKLNWSKASYDKKMFFNGSETKDAAGKWLEERERNSQPWTAERKAALKKRIADYKRKRSAGMI